MAANDCKRVILLGSTGSIGRQALEVLAHLNALHAQQRCPHRYEVVGLSAGRQGAALLKQAAEWGVRDIAILDGNGIDPPADIRLRRGPDGAEQLVRDIDADILLGAMVGAAGLPATLAAIERCMDIALANKETLVAAGELVIAACKRTGARLLPVDSEHSGVWQALAARRSGDASPPFVLNDEVRAIVLTASGGALRDWPIDRIRDATPEQALAHPNWDMGAKVTIDSASLTNKALELVEAHWLFGIGADRLRAVVHPSSIVHALVEYADGSIVAQLGAPDMRTPIQYAFTHPDRIDGCSDRMDWSALSNLEFRAICPERYPALELGFRVIDEGGTSGAVFNAANERAVEAFLEGRINFGRIVESTRATMDALGTSPIRDLADVLEADAEARRCIDRMVSQRPASKISS